MNFQQEQELDTDNRGKLPTYFSLDPLSTEIYLLYKIIAKHEQDIGHKMEVN